MKKKVSWPEKRAAGQALSSELTLVAAETHKRPSVPGMTAPWKSKTLLRLPGTKTQIRPLLSGTAAGVAVDATAAINHLCAIRQMMFFFNCYLFIYLFILSLMSFEERQSFFLVIYTL